MVIGVDVGGTKIIGIEMDGEKILRRWKLKTVNGRVIETLKGMIGDDLAGIGLPCYLRNGVCVKSPNISELNGKLLSDIFPGVRVMNDGTAMAYGEYYLRGEKHHSLLLVALGTGVGAGLVFNGQPYFGRGSAMELGHIKGFSSRKCLCGKEGCLETVLGGRYSNIQEIERRAREGDAESMEYMRNYGRTLGKALSCAIQLLDPEIVVIGGSVANAFDLFIDFLLEELDKMLSFIGVDDIIFEKSKSEESGAIGAALIAQRKLL